MNKQLSCPRCGRGQYWTCPNLACQCHKDLPHGKLAQVILGNDAVACPYCGFTAHIDYWEERATNE